MAKFSKLQVGDYVTITMHTAFNKVKVMRSKVWSIGKHTFKVQSGYTFLISNGHLYGSSNVINTYASIYDEESYNRQVEEQAHHTALVRCTDFLTDIMRGDFTTQEYNEIADFLYKYIHKEAEVLK